MGSREQQAKELEEHITCTLCNNYLTSAVTLTGCLHFFCRSCLHSHLTSGSVDSNKCPICKIELGTENIYKRDYRLQELVYKLVPDLFWYQLRKLASRRPHRSSKDSTTSTSPPQLSERKILKRKMLLNLSTQLCSSNEKISLQIEYIPLINILNFNQENSLNNIPSSSNNNNNQNNYIYQQENLFCRYFLCSAKIKIETLKRLLESKLSMTNFYGIYFISPDYSFVLEDDFSLEDLIQLFNWTRKSPFRLNFTLAQLPPKEDEICPPELEDMPQLDLESGPMELPLQQQHNQQEQQISPLINLNEKNNNDDDKVLKEISIVGGESSINNNGGGDASTTSSTSTNNNIQQSHNQQDLNSSIPKLTPSSPQQNLINNSTKLSSSSRSSMTSPINSNKNISTTTTIPRLSTAGVSPLRPVPSLIPQKLNNNTITNQPPIKKRQRNLNSKISKKISGNIEQNNSSTSSKGSTKRKLSPSLPISTTTENSPTINSNTSTNNNQLPSSISQQQQQLNQFNQTDYINFMQNMLQQYQQQQQNKQQINSSSQFIFPNNIFGSQQQQQFNQQLQMRTMMTNQMLGAMGIFGGINNGCMPFVSDQQISSFQLPSNTITTTKPCKTSIHQNNINGNIKNEKSPIKAKRIKLSSSLSNSQQQIMSSLNSSMLTGNRSVQMTNKTSTIPG